MRKIVFLLTALLSTISLMADGTTENITLNGQMEPTCVIASASTLNMTLAGVSDSVSNFNVKILCNSGLNWTTTIDGGANANGGVRRAAKGSDYITYRLYSDSGMTAELASNMSNTISSAATGSTETINIYSKVAIADNNPLPPVGTYNDTLNVTISW